jgi:sRNA-binding carbon storage regulator CsrA
MNLCIKIKRDSSFVIEHPDGSRVVGTVYRIQGDDSIRIAFDAPREIIIDREVVFYRKHPGEELKSRPPRTATETATSDHG